MKRESFIKRHPWIVPLVLSIPFAIYCAVVIIFNAFYDVFKVRFFIDNFGVMTGYVSGSIVGYIWLLFISYLQNRGRPRKYWWCYIALFIAEFLILAFELIPVLTTEKAWLWELYIGYAAGELLLSMIFFIFALGVRNTMLRKNKKYANLGFVVTCAVATLIAWAYANYESSRPVTVFDPVVILVTPIVDAAIIAIIIFSIISVVKDVKEYKAKNR